MIALANLVRLQAIYACVAIAYLALSLWRLQSTGEALSAVTIGPSMAALFVYWFSLLLPRYGFIRSYRGVMLVALLIFGGGGVIGNIVRYMDSGLEHYASLPAFVIAVSINAYGTVLNVFAALGWYTRPAKRL